MGKLDALIDLSRRYGSDPAWVLAGGGNSSWKDGRVMRVKSSGTALGTIGEGGFCAVDLDRLDAIWDKAYPEAADEREAAVLADLMASRLPGEDRRPSVETLMHGLFPRAYVLHTHPALVNGMACGLRGREAFEELLAEIAVWVPFVEPGYVLARRVREELEAFATRRGRLPDAMVMQNHGLLVAADDTGGIDRLSGEVVSRIRSRITRHPDVSAAAVDAGALSAARSVLSGLAGAGTAIAFRSDAEILSRASSPGLFHPLSSAFTPDHIVYAGHEFLYVAEAAAAEAAWTDYVSRNASNPRVAVIRGLGAFGIGPGAAAAETALALFADACAIAAYAESFGGALHMSKFMVDFIRGWEVERYRSAMLRGGA